MTLSLKLTFLFTTLIFLNGSSQDNEPESILPEWKLGDKRTVTVRSSTTVSMSELDSAITDNKITGTYTIEVIRDTPNYHLRIEKQVADLDMDMEGFEGTNSERITAMVRKISAKLSTVTFIMEIDRESGTVTRLVNEEEVLANMESMITDIVDHFAAEDTDSLMTTEMTLKMKEHMISLRPQAIETLNNPMNLIFQPHSYTFLTNDSLTQQIDTYEVSKLMGNSDTPISASMTTRTQEQGDTLTLNTSLDIDKDELIQQMEQNRGTVDFSAEDMTLIQTETIRFDLATSWILDRKSHVSISTPGIKIDINDTITFTEE